MFEQRRLIIEGDWRPELRSEAAHRLFEKPNVCWMAQANLISTASHHGDHGTWSFARIAEHLASQPPHKRALKPTWWISGWGRIGDGPDHTTVAKVIRAAEQAIFDTSFVWPRFRKLMDGIRNAKGLNGLAMYFEFEEAPMLHPAVVAGILASPIAKRNLLTIGDAPGEATDEQWHEAVTFVGQDDIHRRCRAALGRFQNALASAAAESMLRRYLPAMNERTGMWWLSNTSLFPVRDDHGHPTATIDPLNLKDMQASCVYMHAPDGFIPPGQKRAIDGINAECAIRHYSFGAKLVPNISAFANDAETIARRTELHTPWSDTAVIFAGDLPSAEHLTDTIARAADLLAAQD